MRALILETGRTRSALAGARGLSQDGWQVGIGSPLRGLAARSRAVQRWHRLPTPEAGGRGYVDAVREVVRSGGYEIVFPAGDAELLLIAGARDELGAIVPHPPYDTLLMGLDKLELTRAAERAGVAVPLTWDASDARERAFPMVVKPRLKLPSPEDGDGWRLGTHVARDTEEAGRYIAEIARAGVEPVLQEHLEGRLVAWSGVLDDAGAVLVEVQQEAALLWPPSGGVSARAVTVPVTPAVGDGARAVLAELGWIGLVQLQFIVRDDDRPRLIDLNPRFYGSLALAVGAGANLPAISAASASGRRTDPQPARPGQRYQWLAGDVQAQLSLPAARLLFALVGTLSWALRAHHSIWSPRDPAPAVWYLGEMLRRLAGRRT